MDRHQLEHIIRAAADVTNEQHFIIIGSQAILGQYPDAPKPLLISMEADLYPLVRPELSDDIDGSLGPSSRFDNTFGYHADGVSPNTATLPEGWTKRLTAICNKNTNGATGWCIDVHDIAKYAAGREKDHRYTAALWEAGFLDPNTLAHRLKNIKLDDHHRQHIAASIRRQQHLHSTGHRREPKGQGR